MWEQAWLNYEENGMLGRYKLNNIYFDASVTDNEIIQNACDELRRAFKCGDKNEPEAISIHFLYDPMLIRDEEGYQVQVFLQDVIIKSRKPIGILYGVFSFLECLRTGEALHKISLNEKPTLKDRCINHWDNLDGSIERGYAGKSILFDKNAVLINERTKDYARLLASVHVNAIVINNVNVDRIGSYLIDASYLDAIQELCTLFSGYGISVYLSLNFAAPMTLGGLDTCDPWDPSVIAWWKARMAIVFEKASYLKGFLVKADSEGRPGPQSYGRTQSDGANLLADCVAPYGGRIIWRCFVYNCRQDWRDQETDRARAGYDTFMPLDGTFRDQVVLQVKNGPMDFQVREPVSPLLGSLKQTSRFLEVQITQEYTGQQRHVCYLVPMWKEVLDFQFSKTDEFGSVKDKIKGIAGVCNVGNDENWTGHDFATANLYGFGKVAWNNAITSEKILSCWTKLTWGSDPEVVSHIENMLLTSWSTYEKYTTPLGIGWMINPSHHYGPNIDGYEYDRWGTYHRADFEAIGVDRTGEGTGYTNQYPSWLAHVYEDVTTCPTELLLFFHRVPYRSRLKNGETLIQYLYDLHFQGVEDVQYMVDRWRSLKLKIDDKRYIRVLERLEEQLEHAGLWRDTFNTYFYRKTGIKDEKNRNILS